MSKWRWLFSSHVSSWLIWLCRQFPQEHYLTMAYMKNRWNSLLHISLASFALETLCMCVITGYRASEVVSITLTMHMTTYNIPLVKDDFVNCFTKGCGTVGGTGASCWWIPLLSIKASLNDNDHCPLGLNAFVWAGTSRFSLLDLTTICL